LPVILFGFNSCNYGTIDKTPIAKKGVLDLSSWDFTKDGNVKLNGQWEFYWQNLYKPADFKNKLTVEPDYIKVPKIIIIRGNCLLISLGKIAFKSNIIVGTDINQPNVLTILISW